MTDDANTPGDTAPIWAGSTTTTLATEDSRGPDESGDADERPTGRNGRRWLIALAIAIPIALVLLFFGGIAAVASGVQQMGRDADEARQGSERASGACLDLEKRLNRLTPPGAAADAAERATAIRAENAAIHPFLPRIDQLRDVNDRDGDRRAWQESWRQLLNARTAYADALDRQAAGGQRAFFLAPQTGDGAPALEVLQHAPDSCAGVLRRLAAPDL